MKSEGGGKEEKKKINHHDVDEWVPPHSKGG